MSEKVYDSILKSRKRLCLRVYQIHFLMYWYEIMGKENFEFGFKGVIGLHDQLNAAADLLLESEREWQDLVINKHTDMTLCEYFCQKAKRIGLDLPEDFNEQMVKKEKK